MYRTVDCSIWSDPWFAELRAVPKLLFIYLFTNPRTTPAGTCEISARQIAFDTDIDPSEVGVVLSQLSEKVAWWPDLGVVFIKNFYRYQSGYSHAASYRKAAVRALEKVHPDIKKGVVGVYPELQVPTPQSVPTHPSPTPHPPPSTRTEQNRTDTEQNRPATPLPPKGNGLSSYVTTLNGALPKLESMFGAVDKQYTSVWLWGVLAEVENDVGPLARDQLGRGLDLALDEIRRSIAAGKVKSPRPFARKLIANYLTEQRDEHHAA